MCGACVVAATKHKGKIATNVPKQILPEFGRIEELQRDAPSAFVSAGAERRLQELTEKRAEIARITKEHAGEISKCCVIMTSLTQTFQRLSSNPKFAELVKRWDYIADTIDVSEVDAIEVFLHGLFIPLSFPCFAVARSTTRVVVFVLDNCPDPGDMHDYLKYKLYSLRSADLVDRGKTRDVITPFPSYFPFYFPFYFHSNSHSVSQLCTPFSTGSPTVVGPMGFCDASTSIAAEREGCIQEEGSCG